MSKMTESFINDICSFIKYKAAHKEIREELSLHIEELKESYIEKGASEEEAERKAIANMGKAEDIGEKLNKQHKPQTEWSLIFLTAVISIFGILVMYVSSNFENHPISFGRHILHIVLGFATLIGVYFLDYIKLKKHPVILLSLGIFLMIICGFFGTQYNGVRSWIRIGNIAISINSIVGILFVVAFCGFLEKFQNEGFIGIFKMIIIGISSMFLFVLQPSMSMVFILLVAYAIVLLRAISLNHFGGNKKIQMVSLLSFGGISAILSLLFVIIQSPNRIQRLLMFLDNGASDPLGGGWIYAMGHKLLNAANLIGKASPLSEGNIDWVMPSITTDFALINIIYNFGWLVGIALLITIAVFILRMFTTSNKVKNSFGFYIALISCVMLTLQFLISTFMNLGLCPYLDVSLPFISYGGTNYITNMIYVGLILSVWRKNNILPRTYRNVNRKEKMITFADNKLIIDFGVNKTKGM